MSALANLVTRARLVLSAYSKDGQRTMLQTTGMANEVHEGVEFLLPYGLSALPVGKTADFIVFQVNGHRDHKVAIGGDDPALRIPDLQQGEFGWRDQNGQQIVLRKNKIEVTSPKSDVDVTATQGNINITATGGNVTITVHGSATIMAPLTTISNGGATQPVKLADGSNATTLKAQ